MKLSQIAIATGAAALLISASAVAAQPGFFAGVTAGYSVSKIKDSYAAGTSYIKGDHKGFAYGFQGGYNFDKYVGVETGFTQYNNAHYNWYSGSEGDGRTKLSFYDVDVMADGYLPVASNIDLIAKAGMAYVHTTAKEEGASASEHTYRPKIALGASYAIQPNMDLQATYSRVFKKGTAGDSKYVPNLDMIALSFNYSFGGSNDTNA